MQRTAQRASATCTGSREGEGYHHGNTRTSEHTPADHAVTMVTGRGGMLEEGRREGERRDGNREAKWRKCRPHLGGQDGQTDGGMEGWRDALPAALAIATLCFPPSF